jgi:methionyl-tRNA formyltransferase
LPRYAGLAPYFWVLSSGEKTTGTTVHFMTLKFDEGNILVQESTPIEPGESAFHLFTRLAQVGNGAIFKAVQLVLQGSAGYRQDLNEYTYYSHPSFAAYRQLRANGHCLVRFGEILPTMRNAMQEPNQSQEVRELIIE